MSDEKQKKILENLRQSKATAELQCLECGYKGLVSVIGQSPHKAFYALGILLGAAGGYVYTGGALGAFVGSIGLGAILQASTRYRYKCPSCEQELSRR